MAASALLAISAGVAAVPAPLTSSSLSVTFKDLDRGVFTVAVDGEVSSTNSLFVENH